MSGAMLLHSQPLPGIRSRSTNPGVHTVPQVPIAQVAIWLAPAMHALPQRPQLATSLSYMGPVCTHVGAEPCIMHTSMVQRSMSSQLYGALRTHRSWAGSHDQVPEQGSPWSRAQVASPTSQDNCVTQPLLRSQKRLFSQRVSSAVWVHRPAAASHASVVHATPSSQVAGPPVTTQRPLTQAWALVHRSGATQSSRVRQLAPPPASGPLSGASSGAAPSPGPASTGPVSPGPASRGGASTGPTPLSTVLLLLFPCAQPIATTIAGSTQPRTARCPIPRW